MNQFQIRPDSREEGDKIVRELGGFGYTRASDSIEDPETRRMIDDHHEQYPVIICREDGSITNMDYITADLSIEDFPIVSVEDVIRGRI
jgi:hypothetical protein